MNVPGVATVALPLPFDFEEGARSERRHVQPNRTLAVENLRYIQWKSIDVREGKARCREISFVRRRPKKQKKLETQRTRTRMNIKNFFMKRWESNRAGD